MKEGNNQYYAGLPLDICYAELPWWHLVRSNENDCFFHQLLWETIRNCASCCKEIFLQISSLSWMYYIKVSIIRKGLLFKNTPPT